MTNSEGIVCLHTPWHSFLNIEVLLLLLLLQEWGSLLYPGLLITSKVFPSVRPPAEIFFYPCFLLPFIQLGASLLFLLVSTFDLIHLLILLLLWSFTVVANCVLLASVYFRLGNCGMFEVRRAITNKSNVKTLSWDYLCGSFAAKTGVRIPSYRTYTRYQSNNGWGICK